MQLERGPQDGSDHGGRHFHCAAAEEAAQVDAAQRRLRCDVEGLDYGSCQGSGIRIGDVHAVHELKVQAARQWHHGSTPGRNTNSGTKGPRKMRRCCVADWAGDVNAGTSDDAPFREPLFVDVEEPLDKRLLPAVRRCGAAVRGPGLVHRLESRPRRVGTDG